MSVLAFHDPFGRLKILATRLGGGNSSDALVVVSLRSPKDSQLRELYVEIDGKRITRLEPGQSVRYKLTAGPHRLRVTNTLNARETVFEAVSGKTLRFEAGNTVGPCALFMFFVLGVGPVRAFLEHVETI